MQAEDSASCSGFFFAIVTWSFGGSPFCSADNGPNVTSRRFASFGGCS